VSGGALNSTHSLTHTREFLLRHKADNHFTVPQRVEGWVDQGTATIKCEACAKTLCIVVIFARKNTDFSAAQFYPGTSRATVRPPEAGTWNPVKRQAVSESENDFLSKSTAYKLQARPAPTGPGLRLTAMPCPNLPFNGLHLRNPCKLHGSLLIYQPRRDGRLSWPSWLTHSGRLTHEVVTRQPWIRRRSEKVHKLQTDVLTTEPRRGV